MITIVNRSAVLHYNYTRNATEYKRHYTITVICPHPTVTFLSANTSKSFIFRSIGFCHIVCNPNAISNYEFLLKISEYQFLYITVYAGMRFRGHF